MRRALLPALLACTTAATSAAAGRALSLHGPEPAHTGGFGEPTCRRCHFDGPERPTDASVSIEGLPAAWEPGRSYPLTVVLTGTDVRRGGFQLAVRSADARQAGALAPADSGTATRVHEGVTYLGHLPAGTLPDAAGAVRWSVVWAAPADTHGTVVFHVAANAANDDNSEFGDRIVAAAAEVPAAR